MRLIVGASHGRTASAGGDSVPANTKVPLPGIGTLWLHRVVQTGSSIRVIMIQLDVTVRCRRTRSG